MARIIILSFSAAINIFLNFSGEIGSGVRKPHVVYTGNN
jgi:hypothetical protein